LKKSTFEDLYSRYSDALSKLSDWGITTNSSSRLIKYKNKLQDYAEREHPYEELHELHQFAFVLREIGEITDIMSVLDQQPNEKELEIISQLPLGSLNYEDDSNTKVRDIQYELWLNYLLKIRSISCELNEPDLLFRWGGGSLSNSSEKTKITYKLGWKNPIRGEAA